ncbi:MAG: formate--tetrahydrofolate ligase [Verrucomicrobia bacterium]|nr:formate--tetrahydrofolate ligase [Verrucomicrobiota bacterium]MCG2678549.1 formate--tetrahydrofolate ligase [Kiritimatiellia bacterium]MBU4247464.1 formate--tetrahydrofolate ligase [Verrucomicrobiota bacterium]MBU4292295.1 formate--tetrahydrofolate ligase [Verrucomicrobiota bacterium]MBU4429842.1 formate--tetrahydrofolate ligase [Verrucomicrobiota bacterium]
MKLDPIKMKDWQIAEAAEAAMKPFPQLAHDLGLKDSELIPMGRQLGKVDFMQVLARLNNAPKGKYIDVTAITPTPLGEGKTTTTMGLIEGLGRLGKRVSGAIRQPSGGPTFNVKGSAAGGGLAQCIPLTPLSIRLTGDIDSVTNAHNLAMVALTSRLQHERNYDDVRLAKSGLKRLDIDPTRITMKWAIDFCAQSLRNITIGKGARMDGFEMDSGFQISVSSEIMAILAVAKDLKDLRERMGRIVVASDKQGRDVTTRDLEVDGAMTAWMMDAINPNLLQTIEGQPVFVHAGPFANIAIGQSSIIADELGVRLADYHITESGFAADIGFEKFWNLKCRFSGLVPNTVVIVCTVRALKMHGGGPTVKPGIPLDPAYTKENLELLDKGCENLIAHIETVKKSGVRPVVCINSFHTDTDAEVALIKRVAEAHGALAALSRHWLKGGEGAVELAEAVIAASNEKTHFKFLYDLTMPLRQRVERIAREVYGAKGVTYTDGALEKAKAFEADPAIARMGTCMVKTHLSLSHDPDIKGRPRNWDLPIQDILIYKGAGFVVPVAGAIKLMPGTASNPAFRNIDVDVKTGRVQGLF